MATAQEVMAAREQHAWTWARRLMLMLVGVTACLLASVVGNIYQAGQPRLVPHVVVVDPGERVLYTSRHVSMSPEAVEASAFLKKWLWLSRRRGDDATLMGEMRQEAELLSLGKAHRQLQAYHAATSPSCQEATPECRERKNNPVRTRLERLSIDQLSEKVWRATWYEVWTPTYGSQPRTLRVTGEFTIERRLQPGPFGRVVMTLTAANRSPLALFVTDYWMTEEWEDPA